MKVNLIAAISADGYIARTSSEFPNWTSKEDKKSFVELTKNSVLIFGGNTFRAIGRPLPGRRNIVYSRMTNFPQGVETTQHSPKKLISLLKSEGENIVSICGGSTIYSMYLKSGLVTDVYLTIEPLMFGYGVRLTNLDMNVSLRLVSVDQLNQSSILLHYKVGH